MVNKTVLALMEDPGIIEAGRIVKEMADRGYIVYVNPIYGITVVSNHSGANPPSRSDMNIVFSMRYEIETMFALKALSHHYMATARSIHIIDKIRKKISSDS